MSIETMLIPFVPAILEVDTEGQRFGVRPISNVSTTVDQKVGEFNILIDQQGIKDVDSDEVVEYGKIYAFDDFKGPLSTWFKQDFPKVNLGVSR